MKLRQFFSLENINEENAQKSCPLYFVDMDDTNRSLFLKELQEKLDIALQKLSNKHRSVVVLCEIEGPSSSQAASVLRCSEGTARSRLHCAKEQLKSDLQSYLR
jgi:RNA polymerase sigma-70 factor (ECF subfamily)